MKQRIISLYFVLLLALTCLNCIAEPAPDAPEYDYTVLPLERNGVALHLDCVSLRGGAPQRNILLTHGGGFHWEQPDHFRIVFLPDVELLTEAAQAIARFFDGYRQTDPLSDYGVDE